MSSSSTTQFDPERTFDPERNDGSGGFESPLLTYSFHGIYTQNEIQQFETVQNDDLRKICFYLQTIPSDIAGIQYEVFDTREKKQQADPNHSVSRASARFSEYAVYRMWIPTDDPSFPHELVHLVAHRWAKPYLFETELDTADGRVIKKVIEMVSTSFMQEGLAIAVDEILFVNKLTEKGVSKWVDEFCKDQKNMLPHSLADVINLDGFSSLPNEVVIPFTGSFSKFLIAQYGITKYKLAYCGIKETLTPKENVAILENIYGSREKDLLDTWTKSLEADLV